MTVRRGRVLQVKSEEIGAIGAEISSGARLNSQSVSFELMTTGMWKETEFPDEAGRASTVTEVERGRWNDFLFRPGTKMSVSLPKIPIQSLRNVGRVVRLWRWLIHFSFLLKLQMEKPVRLMAVDAELTEDCQCPFCQCPTEVIWQCPWPTVIDKLAIIASISRRELTMSPSGWTPGGWEWRILSAKPSRDRETLDSTNSLSTTTKSRRAIIHYAIHSW